MDAIDAVAREYQATKRLPDLAVRRNLVECLRSDDPLVRFMSIGTLSDITGQTKGYRHDAPEALRMVASLGGFLGRKGDGEPGAETTWKGLERLTDIAAVFGIFFSSA